MILVNYLHDEQWNKTNQTPIKFNRLGIRNTLKCENIRPTIRMSPDKIRQTFFFFLKVFRIDRPLSQGLKRTLAPPPGSDRGCEGAACGIGPSLTWVAWFVQDGGHQRHRLSVPLALEQKHRQDVGGKNRKWPRCWDSERNQTPSLSYWDQF